MDLELTRRLLLYIVDQLQDMESPISTIRLVKLLYLVDLEYYNRHYETLTGAEWVKYNYGPYFFAWPEIIRSAGLDLETEEIETEHGRGVTFRSLEAQDISDAVSFPVQAMIHRILEQWAHEDTPVLLEHVYETLPVRYGHHREPLDFTLETDHLLLERTRETASDFLTIDELAMDYEQHATCNE